MRRVEFQEFAKRAPLGMIDVLRSLQFSPEIAELEPGLDESGKAYIKYRYYDEEAPRCCYGIAEFQQQKDLRRIDKWFN